MSAIRRFIAANVRVSRAIGRHLPRDELQAEYDRLIAAILRNFDGPAVVVDVGGGKRCHFAKYRPEGSQIRIVAVDLSADELTANRDADETRVADVTKGVPFADEEVDLITARSVLEHLRGTEAFIRHAARVLKPGGHLVVMFPGRNSPSALLNRLLPASVSRRLLHALVPESRDRLGFPAYYDQTSARAMQRILRRSGFELLDVKVSYWQSPYFEFFVPLFLVSLAYERMTHALGFDGLAATVLIGARKRPPSA